MKRTDRSGNGILDALPRPEYHRLEGEWERVRVPEKELICNGSVALRHAYFPLSGVMSVVVVMADGALIEAAAVGREGMLGLPLLVSGSTCLQSVVQQVEGESLKVRADVFRKALRQSGALNELVTRYTLALLHQVAQNAACNLLHTLDERMARWLLATRDRLGENEFSLTHELLADTLGVHRQSVSLRAGLMQRAGLISYRRGRLKIVNARKLADTACECYAAALRVYEDLLSAQFKSIV